MKKTHMRPDREAGEITAFPYLVMIASRFSLHIEHCAVQTARFTGEHLARNDRLRGDLRTSIGGLRSVICASGPPTCVRACRKRRENTDLIARRFFAPAIAPRRQRR